MEEQRVFSVTEVNGYIKNLIDGTPMLNGLLIRGELSNYKIYLEGRRMCLALCHVPRCSRETPLPPRKRHESGRIRPHQRVSP